MQILSKVKLWIHSLSLTHEQGPDPPAAGISACKPSNTEASQISLKYNMKSPIRIAVTGPVG